MKKFLLVLFALISINVFAQSDSFKVKEGSFHHVQGCVTIPAHTDQNDLPMGVIKIVTDNINEQQRARLRFEGNLATGIEVEQHEGETWVYVTARAATFLRIKHPDFGVTEFNIPMEIEANKCYEMTLQYVSNNVPVNTYISVDSEPSGADIYIDGKHYGKTPNIITDLPMGKHEIKLEKQEYNPVTKIFIIEEGEKLKFNETLLSVYYKESAVEDDKVAAVEEEKPQKKEKPEKKPVEKVKPEKKAESLLKTSFFTLNAQESIDSLQLKRNIGVVLGTEAVLYAGSMTGLYYLWYADYPQSKFHFYNDNAEWLQMDKAGHATTAYHVGMIGYEALRLAGWDEKHSLLYGGPLGFVFLTTVEIFDGLSDGWGFSWGDMAANALGTGLFMGQQALWHEQRISMKYSYHNTQFPQYRPDLLGSTLPERMLKDYNGQTIWLSFNIKSLFMNDESKFPSWINVALGYSGEGMTGGFYNTTNYNGQIIPEFERARQFVISPDIDLTRIPVKNKFLKSTLKVLSFIKIPMPAVMCDSQGNFSWHWLYF